MFGNIFRKLSGDRVQDNESIEVPSDKSTVGERAYHKKSKRHRSGGVSSENIPRKERKRSRLNKSDPTGSANTSAVDASLLEDGELSDLSGDEYLRSDDESPAESTPILVPPPTSESITIPAKTPEWGIKLFQYIQLEFKNVNKSISLIEQTATSNSEAVKSLENKLTKMELWNSVLQHENSDLREKMLELEFKQRRNNLIFEGLPDSDNESDVQCISKVRNALNLIPGLDTSFRIDKCHHIDGAFNPPKVRRVMCTLNWYVDVQFILRNRKRLPKGIFVSEDYPEEWVNRRKILKPIFNAAKKNPKLRSKTFLSKDKLVIDGHTFTAAPVCNIGEVKQKVNIDLQTTCERSDNEKIAFLGSLSPFSNLHLASFWLNNEEYSSTEQYIQSEKAKLFDDDELHSKIMRESNTYKIKNLGSKVRKFSRERWHKHATAITYKANYAKYAQNKTLSAVLLATKDKLLVESSTDPFWGSGVHLHDKNALDRRAWENKEGGKMCSILSHVQSDLQKKK